MNCLSCGCYRSVSIEFVCSEECRKCAVELYENVINQTPICARNRSKTDPTRLNEKGADEFRALVEKIKNAPVLEAIR